MDIFHGEDLDSICYIDEKDNSVIIKFYGFTDILTARIFLGITMGRLGFDYNESEESFINKRKLN
jgi:prolipoprotein diacylglyceryltransferase